MMRKYIKKIFYPVVIENRNIILKPIQETIHFNNEIITNIKINEAIKNIDIIKSHKYFLNNYWDNIYGKLYFQNLKYYDYLHTYIPLDIKNSNVSIIPIVRRK